MNQTVCIKDQFRRKDDFSEFEIFDGEDFIKFDIIGIDEERNEITIAVTYQGRISVITYDLLKDSSRSYFEYGSLFTQINVDEFEEE